MPPPGPGYDSGAAARALLRRRRTRAPIGLASTAAMAPREIVQRIQTKIVLHIQCHHYGDRRGFLIFAESSGRLNGCIKFKTDEKS
jgi:hypothetical protein